MVVLSSFFLNPAGIVTAFVLIPFIILYLIRPKPHHERIPSLLFIMKDTGKTNVNSFFRTFLKDILFLLHFLLLLLLIAAVMQPYIEVPHSFLAEQTILLVDASASMQSGDRFDRAIAIAESNLGRENTVITITGNPAVLLERAGAGKAKDTLKTLEPTDTETSISDALHLASSYAGAGTRVVIISDFIATAGDRDFDTAAALIESSGASVEYEHVTSNANNVGIIDLAVGPTESQLWIKNYNRRPADITLKISEAEQQVLLGPGESKEITFNTPPGIAKISIEEEDDLDADNTVWTSTPEENEVDVLFITNDRTAVEQSHAILALKVISQNFPTKFNVEFAEPPKMPKLNHDIYFFYEANLDFILPGYVKDLKEQVENGASVVIFTQEALFSIDWQGLLPVSPVEESSGQRGAIVPNQEVVTEDIEFGQANEYLRVKTAENGIVIASIGDDPVIVMAQPGKGNILYYGIDDEKASFSRNPSYPVFWRRVLDRLTHRPSLENLNVRTGGILTFPTETKVKTPGGTLTGTIIPVERAGLYTYRDRTLVANMISDEESELNKPVNLTRAIGQEGNGSTDKVPKDLSDYLLWLALALLILEIIYLKYRGDF
ncbi:VWA domain-containing protein [Candidatus Woesearchaeota archaeon]|nr:VWA domain-containing protein [Candidatus Woesearchaeota archaeon]